MAFRCVVADDHPAIVQAVCSFLEGAGGVEVAGRAADGAEAFRLISELRPDVAVLDIRMPVLDGIDVARRVSAAGLPTAVILFTGHPDRPLVLDGLDAGARGFVAKDSPLDELVRAIGVVAGGGTFVDPKLGGILAGPQAERRLGVLSKRELEILRLLADGMRNDDVAAHLAISPSTVRTHVKHAMEKLEADTRTQAVARALRDSLIS